MKMQHSEKLYLNWTNLIFFTGLPIIAIVGTALLCAFGVVRWPTWILAVSYMFLSGFAITAGYHRLFSHKTYQAAWPLRLLFLLLSAATFEGSALEWCTDHRNHHRYTDTDKDPYNINRGFWYAHIGWIFQLDTSKRDLSNVQDLQEDRWVSWQNKYYVPLAIFMGFIVPTAIAALWGDPWGGLIVAGALRMTLNHHFTFAINSVCHYFGKRTYSERQTARDNWLTAFFTMGEGFHNFHHQFPLDYRNGIRAFHFDPTKWLIYACSWLGLTRDLQRVGEHRIVRYRVQMEEQRVLAKLTQTTGAELSHLQQMLEPARHALYQVLAYMETLEKEYWQLRKQKLEKMYSRMSEYRLQLRTYRQQLKTARQELKDQLLQWTQALRDCQRLATSASIS